MGCRHHHPQAYSTPTLFGTDCTHHCPYSDADAAADEGGLAEAEARVVVELVHQPHDERKSNARS
jgi:hypothetical protein